MLRGHCSLCQRTNCTDTEWWEKENSIPLGMFTIFILFVKLQLIFLLGWGRDHSTSAEEAWNHSHQEWKTVSVKEKGASEGLCGVGEVCIKIAVTWETSAIFKVSHMHIEGLTAMSVVMEKQEWTEGEGTVKSSDWRKYLDMHRDLPNLPLSSCSQTEERGQGKNKGNLLLGLDQSNKM